jgi:glycosidase
VDPCGELGSIESLYNARGKTSGITSEDGSALNAQQTVVNFSENHDVGRLLYFLPTTFSPTERRELLHLGLGYLLTAEGIPSLYYGVEQEFDGGNDPANRETMWSDAFYTTRVWEDARWIQAPKEYDSTGDGVKDKVWGPFDTGNPTFAHVQRLIALRKAHVSLRRGAFKGRWSTRTPGGEDHGLFAFERVTPEETALVVLNYGKVRGSSTATAGDSMVVSFPAGTTLVDALEPERTFQTTHAGCAAGAGESCVVVSVPARKFRVLLPQ